MKVFGLSKSQNLANKIVESLGIPSDSSFCLTRFKDGEFEVEFKTSIRGENVYLVQSTVDGADSLMELCLAVDAAKRASANKVIAVIPYFGWARQDRKSKPRVSIGAKVVANMLQSVGCNRVITVDLHADQEQGFFDIPLDHVHASSIILEFLGSLKLNNSIIVAPDFGASKRAMKYAEVLNLPIALCSKLREKPNEVAKITLIGDVEGKDCYVIDDMVDTAGTLCKVAEVLKYNGAHTINCIATHGVLSEPACQRINYSCINKLYLTNTIEKELNLSGKIYYLDIANHLAQVILRVESNKSISELYLI